MSPNASCAKWVMPTRTVPLPSPRHPLVLGGVSQILRDHQTRPSSIGAPGPTTGAAAPVRRPDGRVPTSSARAAPKPRRPHDPRRSRYRRHRRPTSATPPGMFNAVRIVCRITDHRDRVRARQPLPVHDQIPPPSVSTEVRRGDDPHRRPVPAGDLHRLRAGPAQLLHRVEHPVRPDRPYHPAEPDRQTPAPRAGSVPARMPSSSARRVASSSAACRPCSPERS